MFDLPIQIVQDCSILKMKTLRSLETRGITCAHTVSSPLAHICNRSLDTRTFPSRLKFSVVRPIFKKGATVLCLITDRNLCYLISRKYWNSRLYQHLIENNILSEHEYGFRSNSSTELATYKLLNEISDALAMEKGHEFATWNVRSLQRTGSFTAAAARELVRYKLKS